MKHAIATKLRHLNVCESGCEGRCRECPQRICDDAATEIEALTIQLIKEQQDLKVWKKLYFKALTKLAEERTVIHT